jgi:predicted transcriptional regulator
MKYRRRIELVAEVLAASLKGAKKTHIMNRGNLNFKMINYYLKALLSSGLLSFDSTNDLYFVTSKGKRFLFIFKEYKQHLGRVEKRLRIIEDKKGQLEQMCLSVDNGNELRQSDKDIFLTQERRD